jgi:transposase InsO family protein
MSRKGVQMLSQEDYIVIKTLKAHGVYNVDIAAEIGVHPKTVSRALARGSAPAPHRAKRASKLAPYKTEVDRLLSDNGPAFIANALREYLRPYAIDHIRGRAHHPQTQGKIERYHRSMKSIVKLNTFFFPWELEQAIADFVDYYNHERYHESLDNVTPADVFLGKQGEVLTRRKLIKQQTLLERRRANLRADVYSL